MTNTISDNVTALRIRIPHYQEEEKEEEEYDYEYEQYCEQQYNPYGDLENYYACMEYFEALRRAREQLQSDCVPEHDMDMDMDMDDFSPIYVLDYDTLTVYDHV